MLTAKEVARTIGLSEAHVIRLCEQGRLRAQKIDDAWVIWEDDMGAARKENLRHPPPIDDDPM